MLYFIPAFRAAIFQYRPDPDVEFNLTCEMLFLFQMLASSTGIPCQVG